MSAAPHISLILPVMNGMPYLPEAVASVVAQTYRDFELVVQDGGSTDGSLEFLRSVQGVPHIEIESAPDAGIGQACNRGFRRCRGEIIGTICGDDLLEPTALATVVEVFQQHREAAVIYGAVKMIDATGRIEQFYDAPPFEPLRLIQCECVPPLAASFFSRARCGESLYFDESMKTVTDFDLWLRLGHLPILRTRAVLACTRVSEKSGTCDASLYEQICSDKVAALERFLAPHPQDGLTLEVRRRGVAGIYCWAAESMLWIPGGIGHFEYWREKAANVDSTSPRLQALKSIRADVARAVHDVGSDAEPQGNPTIAIAFQSGVGHAQAGRWSEAARDLSRVIELHPYHAPARHLLGISEFKLGHLEEALQALRWAVALAPDEPAYLHALGLICYTGGEHGAAAVVLRRALELSPDSVEVWRDFGQVCRALGRGQDAVAAMERAVTLSQKSGKTGHEMRDADRLATGSERGANS